MIVVISVFAVIVLITFLTLLIVFSLFAVITVFTRVLMMTHSGRFLLSLLICLTVTHMWCVIDMHTVIDVITVIAVFIVVRGHPCPVSRTTGPLPGGEVRSPTDVVCDTHSMCAHCNHRAHP